MSLLSDTLAKVGSTAIARGKTFKTTRTTNRQQRRSATVHKAIKRYNKTPEQIVVDNPVQNALEVPGTDLGMPFRETLFPDMVINKGTLDDWAKGELWIKKRLGSTAPDQLKDTGVSISPHPILEDTIEYGPNVTPDMQEEIEELLPEQGLGWKGPAIPEFKIPDIFAGLGDLGKYALLGLGAVAVIMLLKK